MSMALQKEPLVVVNEPKEFTITIKKNGYRVIRSLEDSVACQRPGIQSSPRKRKVLLDNGTSKESLIGEHWQAHDEGTKGLLSLHCSTYEDELSLRSNNGSRTTNCKSYRLDRPCYPFSNEIVAPHRDDGSDSSLEVLSYRPSELTGIASGSHGIISKQNHLRLTAANGTPLDSPNNLSEEITSLSNVVLPETTNSSRNSVLANRSTPSTTANEPLANSSARHQQRIKSCNQNLLPVPDCHRPVEDGQSSPESHSTHPEAPNHQVETCSEPIHTSLKSCCRLPFNGHVEDRKHYRKCQIVLFRTVLRGEHTSWLKAIDLGPSYVPRLIDFFIGSTCKEILLRGTCKEGHCPLNHTTQLNFEFPPKYINTAFDIFTKWFLENSHRPDFRAILLILSQLPKNHNNIIMIVLSFSLMIFKLPNKIHRKALCIKLVEIMVNVLELKWWEAVQTLLLFVVTHETEPSEVLDLLSNLEISKKSSKNQQSTSKLYQLVSCLWHLSATFVCPPELIFKVLEDCLMQMPEDLKLTKDRIVADLMTLQLPVIRKAYHLIDKFLGKYYPMNSEIVRVLRSSVLYGNDVSKSSLNDRRAYETCRVKSTGPVNSKWHHWSIQEARTKGFEMVLKNAMKTGQHQKVNSTFRPMPSILLGAEMSDEPSLDNCYNFTGRTSCMTPLMSDDLEIELERVVELLHSEKFEPVVKIISSCDNTYKKNSLDLCIRKIQHELENCNKAEIHRIVIEMFLRLPGSLPDNAAKRVFASMLSSLVVKFYKDADYVTAFKLIKCMNLVGVNHLEHVPKEIGKSTFITVCCDILFQVRLYREALLTLKHTHCLTFVRHAFDGRLTQEYFVLESVVKNMFRRFLRERHADQAMWIFRIIFSAQRDLHYPFDIAKFYEGVVFLSFIRTLKNPCGIGDGANLYVAVDRVCGNSVRFHSITYRSLLVELQRVNSPEDVIRRTLWICLQRKIYPDFSKGPIRPLVLESHLAKEEISIYLKHYFTYLAGQTDFKRMTRHPFFVRLTESPPPDIKPFPISNDIMKTPRTVPEALERLKTVLEEIHPGIDADFHQDHVSIPVSGFEKLLGVFEQ